MKSLSILKENNNFKKVIYFISIVGIIVGISVMFVGLLQYMFSENNLAILMGELDVINLNEPIAIKTFVKGILIAILSTIMTIIIDN